MIKYMEIKVWMNLHVNEHTNNGEVTMTSLAEACAEHFGFLSEFGDTPEEELIFEVASEYFSG